MAGIKLHEERGWYRVEPPVALYVHVPFCFHKCHYCDFYSITRQSPACSSFQPTPSVRFTGA